MLGIELRDSKYKGLFLKTWMTNVLGMVGTIFLFTMIIYLVSVPVTNVIQEQRFQKSVTDFLRGAQKNPLNDLTLKHRVRWQVLIFNNNKLVYSTVDLNLSPQKDISEKKYRKTYFNKLDSDDYLKAKYSEQGYNIYISKLKDYRVSIAKNTVILFAIASLLIGIMVSIPITFFYSRSLKRQFTRMNLLLSTLHTVDSKSVYKPSSNMQKEFILLEENIFSLHKELQKRIDEENKLQKERLDFIKGTNHELKTPIMSIRLVLEGILAAYPEYKDKQFHLQQCIKKLDSMTQLVNEILEASKATVEFNEGSTEFGKLICDIIYIYEPSITYKNLKLEIINVNQEICLSIPEKHAKKIFSNLMSNAIKYSKEGSSIVIKYNKSYFLIQNEMRQPTVLNYEDIVRPFYSKSDSNEEVMPSHGLGLYVVDTLLTKYNYRYVIEQDGPLFMFRINFN